MNENELTQLFQEGSVPERDVQFATAVANDMRQTRIIAKLLKCIQFCVLAGIALGIYILSTLFSPVIIHASSSAPDLFQSPLFHVLAAIICIVAVYFRRPVY